MTGSYPKTDNVNLEFRSYSCQSIAAKKTDKALFDLAWFYSVCTDLSSTAKTDERAVVHVNAPEFYFNITKSAVFQDVIFDGINAFSQIEKITNVNGVNVASQLRTPYWPGRLCSLRTPSFGFQREGDNTELIQLI